MLTGEIAMKKKNFLNFILGLGVILIGLAWIVVSYINTSSVRAQGNFIIGYMFPALGLIFILMGVFLISSYLRDREKDKIPEDFNEEDEFNNIYIMPSRERKHIDAKDRYRINENSKKMKSRLDYLKEDFLREKGNSNTLPNDIYSSTEEITVNNSLSNKDLSPKDKRSYKYCPYCGESLDDNFNYCPYCGKSFVKK